MKINIPEINLPRVVIIGGGFGGITLAEALKKQPVQIVMIDRNNYHTFQPLLYQVATGGLEPDSIAFPIRKWFKGHFNFHFRMGEVRRIDRRRNVLETSIGELSYDYLVIASGSKTNFFGMENVRNASQQMKSIPQALDLRSMILQNFEAALNTTEEWKRNALMNFVVVGGGPTGVETAGALGELKNHILPNDFPDLDIRKMHIHLIEASNRVLPEMSETSSQNAHNAMEKLGVSVWLNTRVNGYDGLSVLTDKAKNIDALTLIWTAGVLGNAIQGTEDIIGANNRLEVDEFNRIHPKEKVFAIGDVALMTTDEYPNGHPMVAPVAIQQAKLLAKNILNSIRHRDLVRFVFKDQGAMATIGRNKAVVDLKKMRFSGFLAWMMWMGVHLFSLAGFRNRLVVFINWFWSYLTYDKGTRLIIRPFIRTRRIRPSRKSSAEKKDSLRSGQSV